MSLANGRPLTGASMMPPMTSTKTATKPAKHGRTKQRFREFNAFIDATLASLTRAEAVVWLILWRDCKPDGLTRTSQADLARRGGMSTKAVKLAVRSLTTKGLLRVVRKGNGIIGPSLYGLKSTTA